MSEADDLATRLSRQLVQTLPSFDRWTSSIWNSETPFGRVGHRQVHVLYYLRYPALLQGMSPTASTFAALFSVRKSVVTRWLAGLEESGFIRRMAQVDDRRSQLIELTDTGIAVSIHIEDIFQREMRQSIEFMPEESMRQVLEVIPLLEQVSANLERARKQRVGAGEVSD